MNPKPLVALNHFTVPLAIARSFLFDISIIPARHIESKMALRYAIQRGKSNVVVPGRHFGSDRRQRGPREGTRVRRALRIEVPIVACQKNPKVNKRRGGTIDGDRFRLSVPTGDLRRNGFRECGSFPKPESKVA